MGNFASLHYIVKLYHGQHHLPQSFNDLVSEVGHCWDTVYDLGYDLRAFKDR